MRIRIKRNATGGFRCGVSLMGRQFAFSWNRHPRIGQRHLRVWTRESAISACGELSPESHVPCRLYKGHDGAHEAVRGPYALASWASVCNEDDR